MKFKGNFYFSNLNTVFVSNVFESFVLTTPDGSRYIFGKYGTTTAYENAETFPLNTFPATRDKQYISSWLLLRVESYDGIHFIDFQYAEQAEKYSYTNRASCKRAFTYNPGSTAIVSQVNTCNEGKIFRTNINSKRLFKIKSLNSTVTFNATTDRTDLDDFYDPDANNTTFKKQLDNIEIKVGNYTSNWQFSYDYFTDNTTGITPLPSYCQRLRLWKLQESTTGLTKPPYTFEYNQKDGENFIANRYTKAIDHWGFYNGVNLNNAQPINIPPTAFNTYTIGGSDRDSYESPMLYGALSKINYPTGGHSAFELEANKIPKSETTETIPWYSSTCSTVPVIGLNGLFWVTNNCCGAYPSLPYTPIMSFLFRLMQIFFQNHLFLFTRNWDK